jgi:hypothetical protein
LGLKGVVGLGIYLYGIFFHYFYKYNPRAITIIIMTIAMAIITPMDIFFLSGGLVVVVAGVVAGEPFGSVGTGAKELPPGGWVGLA